MGFVCYFGLEMHILNNFEVAAKIQYGGQVRKLSSLFPFCILNQKIYGFLEYRAKTKEKKIISALALYNPDHCTFRGAKGNRPLALNFHKIKFSQEKKSLKKLDFFR